MGSDWAKNCTVAAIRNSDSSRTLSLASLLIFIVPIIQPLRLDLKICDLGRLFARARNHLLPCWSNGAPVQSYRGNDLLFHSGTVEMSGTGLDPHLSLIHISEPTRLGM